MKRMGIFIIFIIFSVLTSLASASFDDIDRYRECSQCGMDRKTFGFSRTLLVFDDGSQTGLCSLHCAVNVISEHKGSAIKSFLAADRNSRALIDAEKAFWVVGGSKRGVMTQNPKWAFATKDAAQSFVDSNGGKITSWNAALQAAREDAAPKLHHDRPEKSYESK